MRLTLPCERLRINYHITLQSNGSVYVQAKTANKECSLGFRRLLINHHGRRYPHALTGPMPASGWALILAAREAVLKGEAP